MMGKIDKLLGQLFSQNDELSFKVFCFSIALGSITALVGCCLCFIAGVGWLPALMCLLGSLLVVVLGYIGKQTGHYRAVSIVISLFMNIIVFPILYVTTDGPYSCVPLFFILGLFLCLPVLRGKQRLITFTIEFLFYIVFMWWLYSIKYFSFPSRGHEMYQTMMISLCVIVVVLYIYMTIALMTRQYGIERKKANDLNIALKEQSYKDFLTQAYNRIYLMNYMDKQSHSECIDYGICMIDIDDFKIINDTYGHTIGDIVLKELSDISKDVLGNCGFVSRFGGEEFILIYHYYDKDIIETTLDELRRQLKASIQNSHKFDVTLSCGVYHVNENKYEVDILNEVDCLMYEAKHNGKDCVVFKKD